MTDRGISTVLDVATCLLLITAAVGVLLAAPTTDPTDDRRSAPAVADALTTSTAHVEYDAGPADRESAPSYPSADGAYERSAHGTLAELLVAAAIADGRIDGTRVVPGHEFGSRVETATGARIGDAVDDDARVDARWEPYPDAPVGGAAVVGTEPPPDADVETATATVSPPARCRTHLTERIARHHGYGGLARHLSTCAVRAWFPPEATGDALRGQPPAPALVEHRYRRAGEALEVDVADPVATRDVETANDRLITALARVLAADLRQRYETPESAADATTVDEVVITVRTW